MCLKTRYILVSPSVCGLLKHFCVRPPVQADSFIHRVFSISLFILQNGLKMGRMYLFKAFRDSVIHSELYWKCSTDLEVINASTEALFALFTLKEIAATGWCWVNSNWNSHYHSYLIVKKRLTIYQSMAQNAGSPIANRWKYSWASDGLPGRNVVDFFVHFFGWWKNQKFF